MGEKMLSILNPDVIGPPECPIMHRWTIFPPGFGSKSTSNKKKKVPTPGWLPKLLLHHFMPRADERHFHDHPRGFWTLVIWGGYDDMVPCISCDGVGVGLIGAFDYNDNREIIRTWSTMVHCEACHGDGVILGDKMRIGSLKYRPPEHTHRTRVHSSGAWTIVVMGRISREWGFRIRSRWMPHAEYKKQYGHGMRCV
jgi:hypothetical protein